MLACKNTVNKSCSKWIPTLNIIHVTPLKLKHTIYVWYFIIRKNYLWNRFFLILWRMHIVNFLLVVLCSIYWTDIMLAKWHSKRKSVDYLIHPVLSAALAFILMKRTLWILEHMLLSDNVRGEVNGSKRVLRHYWE